MTVNGITALAANSLIPCHVCALVSRAPELSKGRRLACPRCGTGLRRRISRSLSKTWALVIAAYILYVPANLLPVLQITSFGKTEADTILDGVQELAAGGLWSIAALVFVASIVIPIVKLLTLSYLLLSVRLRWQAFPKNRTWLFRVIEVIGHWSMVDVFMVSILVALIQFQKIATIEAGMGIICFAAVVILTLLATRSFDPRLVWDAVEEKHDRR